MTTEYWSFLIVATWRNFQSVIVKRRLLLVGRAFRRYMRANKHSTTSFFLWIPPALSQLIASTWLLLPTSSSSGRVRSSCEFMGKSPSGTIRWNENSFKGYTISPNQNHFPSPAGWDYFYTSAECGPDSVTFRRPSRRANRTRPWSRKRP
ncbi:hypothetical protein C8F01DRAFT_1152809 [Mycena amicta]|nr:hypothetical protein C8F01DRAFT_1152809 [Mycena amicta]